MYVGGQRTMGCGTSNAGYRNDRIPLQERKTLKFPDIRRRH